MRACFVVFFFSVHRLLRFRDNGDSVGERYVGLTRLSRAKPWTSAKAAAISALVTCLVCTKLGQDVVVVVVVVVVALLLLDC